MNKNDAENIALIIAEAKSNNIPNIDFWIDRLSSLDKRIEDSLDFFVEMDAKEEAINNEYERLMINAFGNHWMLNKDSKHFSKDLYNKAEENINKLYGEYE